MTADRIQSSGLHALNRIRCRSFRRGGFTLFELILVMAIIALALAIAAPTLAGFVRRRATSDIATQFVAATHYARTQAIADGVTYHINLDCSNNHWWITKDDGTGIYVPATADNADFTVPLEFHLASTLGGNNGIQIIEFNPTGRTDTGTVSITGKDGDLITITCDSPFDIYHIVAPGGTR